MKDLTKKSKVELGKELADIAVRLRDLRFGMAGGKSKNVKEQKNLKREIARIKTQMRIMN